MKISLQSSIETAISSCGIGSPPSMPNFVFQGCDSDFRRQRLFSFPGCDGCCPFFYVLINKNACTGFNPSQLIAKHEHYRASPFESALSAFDHL